VLHHGLASRFPHILAYNSSTVTIHYFNDLRIIQSRKL
jgi:hypothetical protein